MDNQPHVCFPIHDRSYLSIYKKDIHKLVTEHEFPAKRIAEIDIVVAELTSNLLKHAKGGELLAKVINDGGNIALELISIDSGPGMTEPAKMMADGVSTTKTLGHGLGAIKRLSDTFQLYTLKDWGTILLSRIYKEGVEQSGTAQRTTCRTVMVPKPGERVSGDGYYQKLTKECWKIFVGDGLGHGADANQATGQAVAAFRVCNSNEPVEILRDMHGAVKRSRGLVATVAVYSFEEKSWRICGVGNIATAMITGLMPKTYMSYNGVVGMGIPGTMSSQQIPHSHNQLLIMCSDGIKTRWDLQRYPLIMKYDASVIAAAIYKDFARKTDDMLVVVSKVN